MKSLSAALVKASAEIGGAVKDKTNPHFRSKYADLSAVIEAIKPALSKNGLTFIQQFKEASSGVSVETVIVHESGEVMSTGALFVPATKQDAQGYGSAITYARRYSLQTAFGVPAEDDDGNAASKQSSTTQQKLSPVAATMSSEGISVSSEQAQAVDQIRNFIQLGDDARVVQIWNENGNDGKVAIWSLLDSKERAAIKKLQKEAA